TTVAWCSRLRVAAPFFFTHPAHTEIYTLSLHDALPISEIEEVRRQIAELQTLNAQLEAQLLEYDNDEVIERIAREQLRLVTPGERPVIVIEAPAEDNADR